MSPTASSSQTIEEGVLFDEKVHPKQATILFKKKKKVLFPAIEMMEL